MALQDHFRPPLSVCRHCHAFHNAWATYIASHLNQQLPEGYFAEANVQFGIELDVATFEEPKLEPACASSSSEAIDRRPTGLSGVWTVPVPTQTVSMVLLPDVVEVLVFDREAGPTLAGVIELVSPASKDRQAHRDAFISKCAANLQQGVGLVIVDVVTDSRENLHEELLVRLHSPSAVPLDAELYAVAYRPVKYAGQTSLDIWQEPLAVGRSLPIVPLWLRGNLCLPVDLDTTYNRTCQEQRLMAK